MCRWRTGPGVCIRTGEVPVSSVEWSSFKGPIFHCWEGGGGYTGMWCIPHIMCEIVVFQVKYHRAPHPYMNSNVLLGNCVCVCVRACVCCMQTNTATLMASVGRSMFITTLKMSPRSSWSTPHASNGRCIRSHAGSIT